MTPEDQKRMDEFFGTNHYDATQPWQQSKEAEADPDDEQTAPSPNPTAA